LCPGTRGSWRPGYDLVARRYAELEAGDGPWPRMRWLQEVIDRLPHGSPVLDLGCGSGVPAAAEIAKRHSVTGVDISATQIALARQNVAGGDFVCADAAEVDFPAESFEAVVSFYSFDHLPRHEHQGVFDRIHRWLRPGGLFLLSTEDADEPGVVSQWLGAEMYFSMFDAPTTRRLVEEAGFVVERTAIEVQIEQGIQIPYSWILARKKHS
jgi:SAM-dependent methyltransferase